MANFLDATADIDLRLNEYAARLARVEAHLRRGETRAARARLTGFLEELVVFAQEIELPLETIVVGAQLGFFSGNDLLRGRLPAAILGAAAGWLYGQQVLQQHRLMLEAMAEKVAALTIFLETQAREAAADTLDEEPGAVSQNEHERRTMEIEREERD